jgi:hypothetical protein
MIASRFAKWLPMLLAVTFAVDGWLMLGPMTQLTLLLAAILRRARGTLHAAANTLVLLPPRLGDVAIPIDKKRGVHP